MKKVIICIMVVVGLSGCSDAKQISQLKSQIQFHKMDAQTKGIALAKIGKMYRSIKAEKEQLVIINKKLRGGVEVTFPQTEGQEVVFEEPVPYIEPPRKPKLLPLAMYKQLEDLTRECKSADNKLLALMSERRLLLSDYTYIENLVIDCTAFNIRMKLEKGE